MKTTYRSLCGRFEVEFDEPDMQSLFEKIATFQEVFESDTNVYVDGTEVPVKDIKFRVRGLNTENRFYEAAYVGNNKKLQGYRVDFSCGRNGNIMYPKKKDRDGNTISNNGWYKYVPQETPDKATSEKDVTKNAPY